MEKKAAGPDNQLANRPSDSDHHERLVYVVSQESLLRDANDEIDLKDIWNIVWEGKWLITGITSIFVVIFAAYALLATEWFRADVLLAPAEEGADQGLASQFGGLASLMGINVGQGNEAEALAVLKSRDFAREFIEDENLLPILLADEWDSAAGRWAADDTEEWPDSQDGEIFFSENVRSVEEDIDTGLVKLTIEWIDAKLAAEWATLMVERLNDRMRKQALVQAEANVEYLQSELAAAQVISLQVSISQFLENELQKLMLARGNEEFAYRVIDSAQVPKERSKPHRTLLVAFSILLGGFIGAVIVLVRHSIKNKKKAGIENAP
jgi:LPS O-antigen subunit length determinant protein (WzzB/FepE family)